MEGPSRPAPFKLQTQTPEEASSMNQTFSQQELRNWHKSMTTRVANVAEEHGRSKESIQYQLVFECFLSRIFGEPSSGWTLKGGTALLMRNGSGRFTKDVELARAHEWEEINRIAQELEKLAQRTGADPFTFKVCLLYTSPSPRDRQKSRMPSSA